jgi:hypothetical protein
VDTDGIKAFAFPKGIFEIDEQMLIPANTSISGANGGPNDMINPERSPNWQEQTVFLATRGATDYHMNYCHAKVINEHSTTILSVHSNQDMVNTRVGFVLSSFVTMRDLSYQGIDTIRPSDNGGLCGGGVFETKGCAENNCMASDVNNGGSDGMGSHHVTIDNVRLNDYYYQEDKAKIGASVPGNYDCKNGEHASCCFCKPNGIRSSQVGVWVPQTRNAASGDGAGTHHILVSNLVSRSTQADAINLHGIRLYVTCANH